MGSFGVPWTELDPWVASVDALVSEKYRFGGQVLTWAKLLGPEPFADQKLSKFADYCDVNEQDLQELQRDLWGLLQQQSANVIYDPQY